LRGIKRGGSLLSSKKTHQNPPKTQPQGPPKKDPHRPKRTKKKTPPQKKKKKNLLRSISGASAGAKVKKVMILEVSQKIS